MNAKLVFGSAVAAVAMSFVAAAPASAETEGSLDFEISDGMINPGDNVRLFASCFAEEFTSTPVVSDILDAPDLTGEELPNGGWFLTSDATVRPDTAPGTYPVSYLCGDTRISRNMVVNQTNPDWEIGVVETTIRPGQEVTVRAVCSDPAFSRSWTHSPALEMKDPWFSRAEGASPADPMTVTATVKPDVAPGTYPISFTCGGYVSGEFTVVAAAPSPTTSTTPNAPAPVKAQVPVKPKGGAATGSLDLASQS